PQPHPLDHIIHQHISFASRGSPAVYTKGPRQLTKDIYSRVCNLSNETPVQIHNRPSSLIHLVFSAQPPETKSRTVHKLERDIIKHVVLSTNPVTSSEGAYPVSIQMFSVIIPTSTSSHSSSTRQKPHTGFPPSTSPPVCITDIVGI